MHLPVGSLQKHFCRSHGTRQQEKLKNYFTLIAWSLYLCRSKCQTRRLLHPHKNSSQNTWIPFSIVVAHDPKPAGNTFRTTRHSKNFPERSRKRECRKCNLGCLERVAGRIGKFTNSCAYFPFLGELNSWTCNQIDNFDLKRIKWCFTTSQIRKLRRKLKKL